jgi:phytoene synthase
MTISATDGAMLTRTPRQGTVTDSPRVRASLAHCRAVAKQRASNFYYGLRLTPEPKRSAMYTLYTVLRVSDDLADAAYDGQEPPTIAQRCAAIDRFEAQLQTALTADDETRLPAGPIWPAFRYVMAHYPVQLDHLRAMLQAQRDELNHTPFHTFDELYRYCYNVAGTVGLMCVAIWGHDGDPRVVQWAEQRGVALQLTNILRDVHEDARDGRCYLPAEELQQFGCSLGQLRAGRADENFDRLMRFQIQRAEQYYAASTSLEAHLSRDCVATSDTLMRLYHTLLQRIALAPRAVLHRRVRLSTLEKLRLAGRAWWQARPSKRQSRRLAALRRRS